MRPRIDFLTRQNNSTRLRQSRRYNIQLAKISIVFINESTCIYRLCFKIINKRITCNWINTHVKFAQFISVEITSHAVKFNCITIWRTYINNCRWTHPFTMRYHQASKSKLVLRHQNACHYCANCNAKRIDFALVQHEKRHKFLRFPISRGVHVNIRSHFYRNWQIFISTPAVFQNR